MLGGGKVGWFLWRCKEELEGVTVVRKCNRRFDSWWGGVMVMGRSKRA